MYLGTLQDLGLTFNEAKVYQTLIKQGESTPAEITSHAKIHRRNVYDTLDRLIQKGLVFQILGKGENIYKAVDPAKFLEIIKAREDKLKKILPELQKEFETQPTHQETFIYRGIEGFKNYLRDILKIKKDVYSINAKGIWLDPKLKGFLKDFLQESKRLGLKYHYIFDAELKEKISNMPPEVISSYKFLAKEYSSQATCDIFGDHVVTFAGLKPGEINEDIVIYVLIDQRLADSYHKWFQFMWDKLS